MLIRWVIGVKDSIKELYGEEIDPAYKSESAGILGTVLRIAGVWAEKKYPTYRRLKSLGKYATGEESIPAVKEIASSVYKQHVEKPAKKKARDIFARAGKYATERFDEGVVRYAVQDYINGFSEVPFIPKERIEYEGKDVWGFQDGKKIEYLPAYKIKKDLGEYSEKIREEVGLDRDQFDKALEHYVKTHELAEKRLSEYVGQLSEEQHGWLQARVVDHLRSSEAEAARKVGEVGFRIDRLRKGAFGESIRKYRLAT
jgi:hypothetical protein